MDISWAPFSVAAAGWLLAFLFVLLVFRGLLVSRSMYQSVEHDRDEWRAESRIKDQQISEKDGQLRHMAEVGEAQKALISAIGKLTGQES